MKKIVAFSLMIILIIVFYSCIKPKGLWEDNIHLSTKTAEFSASGDSITIKTGGSWWGISDISVDSTWYADFTGVALTDYWYILYLTNFTTDSKNRPLISY
jgi:hypothetical protein